MPGLQFAISYNIANNLSFGLKIKQMVEQNPIESSQPLSGFLSHEINVKFITTLRQHRNNNYTLIDLTSY